MLSPVVHGGTLENLYRFLLNRPPDPSGAAYFAGKPPAYVAAAIESSTERHRLIVDELLYPRYLRRDADPSGSNYYTGLLDKGYSARQVTSFILGSQEYWEDATTSWYFPSVAWYIDILDRVADTSEQAYWNGQIGSNATRRGPAVHAIEYSDEASERIVDDAYALYLQRPAGPSERTYWAGAMRAGLSVEGFTVAVVASPEFAALWS